MIDAVPKFYVVRCPAHVISSQSLNLGGCWGTTDDVAAIPFHPPLVFRCPQGISKLHSFMLSPHLFFQPTYMSLIKIKVTDFEVLCLSFYNTCFCEAFYGLIHVWHGIETGPKFDTLLFPSKYMTSRSRSGHRLRMLGGWAGRWCWVASSAGVSCYFCI